MPWGYNRTSFNNATDWFKGSKNKTHIQAFKSFSQSIVSSIFVLYPLNNPKGYWIMLIYPSITYEKN